MTPDDLDTMRRHLLTLEDLAKVLVNTGQVMISQVRMVQRLVGQTQPDSEEDR